MGVQCLKHLSSTTTERKKNAMATNISRIKIFTDKNYKISLGAYKKAKKELDLTNKKEFGICIPQDSYSQLIEPWEKDKQKEDIQKAHMFVANFEQILSTSLDKNISANYKSLQPSNDKNYLKINLTLELAELFEEYTKFVKEFYKNVLCVDSNTNKPNYSDTLINMEIWGINYFLGINEFPNHIPDDLIENEIPLYDIPKIHFPEDDIPQIEFPEDDIVGDDYAFTYEKLYNYYKGHPELLTSDEECEDSFEIFIDDLIRGAHDPESIYWETYYKMYWKIYNHNFQQKLYSTLLRKIEPSSTRLDENTIKELQTHTSNSEELMLFVTPTTYKWLNIFKGEFSLSINEIAYYFVYIRLKQLVEYMKYLKKESNDTLYDQLEMTQYNSDGTHYLNNDFLRPYLFREYVQNNYKNVSIYRNYTDIGIILPSTTVDKFYKAFVNYKKRNPKEILPNDYLNFLLKDYFEPQK